MSDLVENILIGNHVEAGKLFESHMESVLEKKLYEIKRSIAISEVVKPVKGKPGEYTGQNSPEDWAKYRKQHPSLGMYDVPGKKPGTIKRIKPPKHEKTASGGLTKHGIEVRRKAGYVQAHPALKALEFIKRVRKYKETGKIEEQAGKPGPFQKMNIEPEMSKMAAAGTEPPRSAASIKPDEMKLKRKRQLSSLDWMTDAGRERAKQARRAAKAKELESDPKKAEKAARFKARLKAASSRDTIRGTAKSIKGGHDVWMGHKEPTTLKGKGIALVRDIFKG